LAIGIVLKKQRLKTKTPPYNNVQRGLIVPRRSKQDGGVTGLLVVRFGWESPLPPIAYPRGNKKVLHGVNPYNTRIQVQFA